MYSPKLVMLLVLMVITCNATHGRSLDTELNLEQILKRASYRRPQIDCVNYNTLYNRFDICWCYKDTMTVNTDIPCQPY